MNSAKQERTRNTDYTCMSSISSYTLAPEKPKKFPYILINGGERNRDQMKRREKENNILYHNPVKRKSNSSHTQPMK